MEAVQVEPGVLPLVALTKAIQVEPLAVALVAQWVP